MNMYTAKEGAYKDLEMAFMELTIEITLYLKTG